MAEYKLKTGKTGKAVVDGYKKVENAFTGKFLDEEGNLKTGGVAEKVTGAYQTIEDTVVGAYKKVETAFVDRFLEKVEEEPADSSKDEQ
ncbi:hypothetical protein [Gemmiger sp.]|uniref:hypothetical protein n=1 Tax=Gemmiger sp. TaxID=2049027 RepID=UPI003F09561E